MKTSQYRSATSRTAGTASTTSDAETRLLHNTKRRTQPWKTGLPGGFHPADKFRTSLLASLTACGRQSSVNTACWGRYHEHPDKQQEAFFFDLLQEVWIGRHVTEQLVRMKSVKPRALTTLSSVGAHATAGEQGYMKYIDIDRLRNLDRAEFLRIKPYPYYNSEGVLTEEVFGTCWPICRRWSCSSIISAMSAGPGRRRMIATPSEYEPGMPVPRHGREFIGELRSEGFL